MRIKLAELTLAMFMIALCDGAVGLLTLRAYMAHNVFYDNTPLFVLGCYMGLLYIQLSTTILSIIFYRYWFYGRGSLRASKIEPGVIDKTRKTGTKKIKRRGDKGLVDDDIFVGEMD